MEWAGWKEGLGLETRSVSSLGRDPGAPKGAKWILEEDCPELGWGLGASEDKDGDSTIRE